MQTETLDFVYKNAPLIEVIAELRWNLIHLTAIPGGAVDPFVQQAAPRFLERVERLGFGFVERLLPEGVPLEMVPGQVVWRCRRAQNTWPVYQIGPGVMTCNATPPYRGWPEFRDSLAAGIEAALAAYAEAGGQISIDSFALRYLNAFTENEGYRDHAEFLDKELGIKIDVREEAAAKIGASWRERMATVEQIAPIERPSGSSLIIKAGNGKKDSQPACLLELTVRGTPQKIDQHRVWFDEARIAIRSVFEAMLSDALKNRMGPREIAS